MSSTSLKPQLKTPTGLLILAFLFILAPLGNISLSFMGSGLANWYEPTIFISLLKTVPLIDWIWLSLLFVTGFLLLKPHKLTWSLAIVTLVFVLSINALRVYQADPNSIDPHFLKVFSVIAVVITLAVLTIAFYFRFPYLDRRTKWTSDEPSSDRRAQDREDVSDRRKS